LAVNPSLFCNLKWEVQMATRKRRFSGRFDEVFWMPPCDETETMYLTGGTPGGHVLDRPVVQVTGRRADLRRIAALLKKAKF
jgi:hypothetical protein